MSCKTYIKVKKSAILVKEYLKMDMLQIKSAADSICNLNYSVPLAKFL